MKSDLQVEAGDVSLRYNRPEKNLIGLYWRGQQMDLIFSTPGASSLWFEALGAMLNEVLFGDERDTMDKLAERDGQNIPVAFATLLYQLNYSWNSPFSISGARPSRIQSTWWRCFKDCTSLMQVYRLFCTQKCTLTPLCCGCVASRIRC